jgi:hypothetical protein
MTAQVLLGSRLRRGVNQDNLNRKLGSGCRLAGTHDL